MIHECVSSAYAESADLRGHRIGFFSGSSGEIFAGDSVILADAIEAVYHAGADVTCWAPAGAAIRRALHERRIGIDIRDWPRGKQAAVSVQQSPTTTGKAALTSRLWRRLAPRSVRRLAGFLSEARRFGKELEAVQPELCIFNLTGSRGVVLAGGMWSKRRSWSILHVSAPPAEKNLLARVLQWWMDVFSLWSCSRVVHVSAAVRDEWCRRCFYPASQTTVIYNGVVDPGNADATAETASLRSTLGLDENDFVFCVPARLAAMKGHDYLLNAILLRPGDFQKARVLICGNGELLDEIRQRCQHPPLNGIVQVLGFRSDILDIMRASDCVMLPSVAAENLSVAALQAMMLAKPVIATAIGGMKEAVIDGKTGIVVPPRSAEALSDAMVRIQDRRWSGELGRSGRAHAIQTFTRHQMMTKYAQAVSEFLDNQPKPNNTASNTSGFPSGFANTGK